MKIIVVICLLCLCIGVSAKEVYKTVRPDGSVVYSDVSSDGAIPLNLSAINTVVVPSVGSAANQAANRTTPLNAPKPRLEYSVFIRSPEAEQTLRNNLGEVSIHAEVLPQKSGVFQLILDNQMVKSQPHGHFQLENVNRGAHSIQVDFLDNSGKILASSKVQTFYLHKASALNRAN